jgi:hypothetical protein
MGKLRLERVVLRALQKHLLGLIEEVEDEVVHLLTVLALPRGRDQGVQAIDKGPIAPVGLGVSGLISGLPA